MANSKGRHGICSLGKPLYQIWSSKHPSPFPLFRRAAHNASTYDKNLDDHVQPSTVPDDVIQPQSDKYWAPHPKTGVFGPASEQKNLVSGNPEAGEGGSKDSVLEEKAWFRPTSIEDLEKPHHP